MSTYEELLPVINGSNNDFIDFANDEAPYWKIYNTASIIGTHSNYTETEDYKGIFINMGNLLIGNLLKHILAIKNYGEN